MHIQEAVQAAIPINPGVVIPSHHLKVDPRKLPDNVEAKSDVKVLNLQIGEIYQLFNKR
jgi:L-ascorbate metabolism protein UlaG (beta-lactamase superfamily)